MAKEAQSYLDVHGLFYQTFIANLHKVLRPETYFEIGTLNGDTLKLAQCASVCVDPMFQIESDIIGLKPSCRVTDSLIPHQPFTVNLDVLMHRVASFT